MKQKNKKNKKSFKDFKPENSSYYLKELKSKKELFSKLSKNKKLEFMIKSIEFNNPGISEKIINAFRIVDRSIFVKKSPYEDMPIHIAHGQTISQPTTIARMLNLLQLEPEQNVLEIGTNTGYHAALVAWLVFPGNVTTIEIFPDLAHQARINIKRLILELKKKFKDIRLHVHILTGDALNKRNEIWSKRYDRIFYTAHVQPENLTRVKKLAKRSLNENGLLLFPTGESNLFDRLELWQKQKGKLVLIKKDEGYAFVPLIRQKEIEEFYKKSFNKK